jgi:hypothetical protein
MAVKHSVISNAFLSHVADGWYVMILREMGIVG